MSDACPLIDGITGRIATPLADKLVDEHFNCILDGIGEWKSKTKSIDISLLGERAAFCNQPKHEKIFPLVPSGNPYVLVQKFFRSKTDQNWPFFQQKLQFSDHFQLKNKHFAIKFFAGGAVF